MKDTKEVEALKGEEWEKVLHMFLQLYLDMPLFLQFVTSNGVKSNP